MTLYLGAAKKTWASTKVEEEEKKKETEVR
jgi:hypothetical protein